MPTITFTAKVSTIENSLLICVPQDASDKLPSRGMTMVEGTINGFKIQTALEPDGKGSHWLKVNDALRQATKLSTGDKVALSVEPSKVWPEPDVPSDLKGALVASAEVNATWLDITPMARWDWIRWIGATKNDETRKRRIQVACSKMRAGNRRPCCFNRTTCTDPYISKNGVLLGLE